MTWDSGRPDPCSYQLYPASLEYGPAEYCTEYAAEGYDLCSGHLEADEVDPDRWRDEQLDQSWGVA